MMFVSMSGERIPDVPLWFIECLSVWDLMVVMYVDYVKQIHYSSCTRSVMFSPQYSEVD